MTKQHHTEQDIVLHTSRVEIRLHPFWRCVCGRVLRPYDVDVSEDTGRIRIICSRCCALLLEQD
jgi:hypothetical protein